MAQLNSWKVNGKNSRVKQEFNRPLSSVSRGNVGGPRIALTFPSEVDGYDEETKERNFNLHLSPEDTAKLLAAVIGDTSQSLISDLFGERQHDRVLEPTWNKLGVYFQTYRVAVKGGFSALQTHLFVRAVNDRHALEQFTKLAARNSKLSFDPNSMEVVADEEIQNQ